MGMISFQTACIPVGGVPLPVPELIPELEPVVVVVEEDNTALKIAIIVVVLIIILILVCCLVFILRKKFHMREQSKTFDESRTDKLMLVGS